MIENVLPSVYPSKDDALSAETDVSPPREARSTDASRLTFPVQMMIGAIVMTAAIVGSFYAMTTPIRELRESQLKIESDVRDMRTRMEMQTQIDVARQDARSVEVKAQNEAINELRRLTQLLQLQYAALEKKVK